MVVTPVTLPDKMTTALAVTRLSAPQRRNGIIPQPPTPTTTTNGPIDQLLFDSSVFQSYMLAFLLPVLGAAPLALESIFDDDEFDECLSRFAAEGGGVRYIVKVRDEAEGE
jgi:dynein heavy chain 1